LSTFITENDDDDLTMMMKALARSGWATGYASAANINDIKHGLTVTSLCPQ